jgi:DNA helicase-2/ATP-dependent DNA helicase PcrA
MTDIHASINKLNERQKEAALAINGPLLIMAGAGSGKTRVLTHRIGYLIASGVAPWSILAITFTNKAAKEMQNRVAALVGHGAEDIWVSTFHSMCVRILRRDIERIGYSSSFSILDGGDQLSVVKSCMKEMNIDAKQFEPRTIQAEISNAKNELRGVDQFEKEAGKDFFLAMVARIYRLYQRKLQAANSLDFDDLIMKTIELFKSEPEVMAFYQKKFHYIHVDEYQDTNRAQYMLCKMLAEQHHNLCVVGDSDQSIYRWRGADITNILNFEKDYPNAKTILLEQNYRSTAAILDAANGVIGNNRGRKPKKLWTDKGSGDKLQLFEADNEHGEAYFVAGKIRSNVQTGMQFADHAILYRTNAQSRVIEEVLLKSDIPYQIVGGIRFYERKEIKDIIAYLRLIANPDDDISFDRVVNVPKRGIGDTTMEKMAAFASDHGQSMYAALSGVFQPELGARALGALSQFTEMIRNLHQMVEYLTVTELVEKMLELSNYREEYKKDKTLEGQARLENIDEFLSVTQDFEAKNEDKSLINFLTEMALVADVDSLASDESSKVILMTMHSAKGLEFPVVFIVGMEESIFPMGRAMGNDDELEEERRLAYVGITRAEQQLFLSHAQSRMLYGRTMYNAPSRFIREIPEELIERIANARREGGFGRATFGGGSRAGSSQWGQSAGSTASGSFAKATSTVEVSKPRGPVVDRDTSALDFKPGDKVKHNKWGIGTVVSVKGTGDDMELNIAFPDIGVKRLLARFAPVDKV